MKPMKTICNKNIVWNEYQIEISEKQPFYKQKRDCFTIKLFVTKDTPLLNPLPQGERKRKASL